MKKVNKEREGQTVQEVETAKGRKRGKIQDGKESKPGPAKKPKVSHDAAATSTKVVPKKKVEPKVNATEPASKLVVIPKPVTDPSRHANTVFLSNLAYETSEQDVRNMMSSSGTITDIRLVLDYKQRCKGFCFVEFSSQVNFHN
jgi:hypothetical protein